jgi:protein-ribulosamine 3-kinase
MEPVLREALSEALGRSVESVSARAIGGGSINDARVLTLDGDQYFFKTNARALPGHFAAEAAGLRALRESGTSLVIPEPLVWSDREAASFLVTEYLEPGRRLANFDELLGVGLAELHACKATEGYGFELDGYCGATPQPNGWMESWCDFYAGRRLGHQLRLARERGFRADACSRLEKLIEKLADWISEPGQSSLIHGDLWSGNLHVAPDGRPALIDPAAYFGHPEAELGMMALFGGFSPRVWQSYSEARRLDPGWRNRLDLYTLYHVLNHFVLFGGGYGDQADEILRRYVG